MKLTSKGRYAVTAMLDVALHTKNAPISLADISERQGISLSYLEQLFAKLRRSGLVTSVRGPGGGYRLNQNPHKISIVQIIRAVNEHIDVTKCGGKGNCQSGKQCLTHTLWSNLSEKIELFLEQITLGELVEQRDHGQHKQAQHAQPKKENFIQSIDITNVNDNASLKTWL